jgi:hypothetical protein
MIRKIARKEFAEMRRLSAKLPPHETQFFGLRFIAALSISGRVERSRHTPRRPAHGCSARLRQQLSSAGSHCSP